jgi:hypothetical protein
MLPEDFHDHVLNAGKAARILLDRYFDRMETILNSLEVSTALDVGCVAKVTSPTSSTR